MSFQKGNNWSGNRKGCESSETHKKNISKALKGKPFTKEHIRNMAGINKGRKHTEEEEKKRVESRRKNGWYKNPEKSRRKISESLKGEKSYRWKGGITSENGKIRQCIEYKFWVEGNFARDDFTCQKCGLRGGKLVAHHIKNFAQYPELRLAIDNGITFCIKCHKEFHHIYGNRNNNEEQIREYLKGRSKN